MKKKASLLVLSMLLTGCSAPLETIKINGNIEQTVEVNTEYLDLGVTYPEDKYSLIVTGKVQTSYLGRYEIKYAIYTKDGELVKKLHRFVTVVDTTSPTYVENVDAVFCVGPTYTADDFFSSYQDNYNAKSAIAVEPSSFTFASPGTEEVTITLKDSSGNTAVYTKTIDVQLDMVVLINEVYKNNKYVVSTSQYSEDETYTHVSIDSSKSLGYFDKSASIHYLEYVTTSLGRTASIQISAKYGEFDRAGLNYHISSNISSKYAYGSVSSFDATNLDSRINSFRFFSENGYQVDETAALNECNENLGSVLANFHDYFANTLHLDLK